MTREEEDVVSCADLDSSIEASGCVSEWDMVALLVLVYNIESIRFLGVLNGLTVRLDGSNENGYIGPLHKK